MTRRRRQRKLDRLYRRGVELRLAAIEKELLRLHEAIARNETRVSEASIAVLRFIAPPGGNQRNDSK